MQGVAMELRHPVRFVVHVDSALAPGILRGHPSGTSAGPAHTGLYTADREHETPRTVAVIRAHGECSGNVESGNDLTTGADADPIPQARTNQGVMHQKQSFLQGRTHVVRKL